MITPWIPQRIIVNRKVVVAPCHGCIFVDLDDERRMTLFMVQRSADVPVGVPFNMIEYAALLLMFAQICEMIPYKFVHILINAHIYINQVPAMEKLLTREDRVFPTLTISESSIKKISDFRP